MSHIPEPDRVETERDQREFDERVRRNTPFVVTGLVALFALALSAVALAQSNPTAPVAPAATSPMGSSRMGQTMAGMSGNGATAAGAATSATAPVDYLKVIPEYKLGPEGKKHDAFTKTEFHVTVGRPLTLRIDNTDTADHSITSPAIGVNIIVRPGVHDYTLLVKIPGRFAWACMLECDEWAMHHVGYMSGYITATAS